MSELDLSRAVWRKSRSSSSTGNCVEVAAVWRKSRRSDNGGNCVEVAATGRVFAVRDSKDPDGPKLVFTSSEWAALVDSVKSGNLDA